MNITKINHVFEYCSASLVLSYFFIHNIVLVFIGICIAIYLINFDFLNKLRKFIEKIIFKEIVSIDFMTKTEKIESESKQVKINKEESKLTLVETIEELGFIPSIVRSLNVVSPVMLKKKDGLE